MPDDAVVETIDPVAVVVPRLKTFYPADKFSILTTGGHIAGFADFEELSKIERAIG